MKMEGAANTNNPISNFWKSATNPIWALAPMEDVTDTVFREVVLRLGHPDHYPILFSEFLSTDGFCHPVGQTDRKSVV